jgi:hypothetical protein
MTSFADAYPSDYLCAADIIGLGPDGIKLVIDRVEMPGTAKFPDGKPVTKPILHFQKAKKGLVCNATNAKRIVLHYGAPARDLNLWKGREIRLICEMVRNPLEGCKTPAIRVAKPGQKGVTLEGMAQ